MEHNELVNLGRQWLLSAKQCNPVFTEKGSSKTGEMPDVIGWTSQGSFLVECKVLECDLIVDYKKPFRLSPESGMGKFRYYLFTTELYEMVNKEYLPEGWGVAVVDNNHRVSQVRLKSSKEWVFNEHAELYYLRNRILEAQQYGR